MKKQHVIGILVIAIAAYVLLKHKPRKKKKQQAKILEDWNKIVEKNLDTMGMYALDAEVGIWCEHFLGVQHSNMFKKLIDNLKIELGCYYEIPSTLDVAAAVSSLTKLFHLRSRLVYDENIPILKEHLIQTAQIVPMLVMRAAKGNPKTASDIVSSILDFVMEGVYYEQSEDRVASFV
jgi:hypothetical protein